jgi:hypothetical protein
MQLLMNIYGQNPMTARLMIFSRYNVRLHWRSHRYLILPLQKRIAATGLCANSEFAGYDFYMRGKFLIEKRNKTDLLIARELFQQAVTKDRTFADAYSGLATTYLLSSFRGYEDPVRMLWLAKKNIDTALGLDPSSGEIQATLGYWYHQTFDWHAAEITYRRSIDLNANQANVYLWLGILLEAKDEKEEALKIYVQGTELNPMWDYLSKTGSGPL